MNLELLSQFRQRFLASEGGHRHLRLEGRRVIPARPLRHPDLLIRGDPRRLQAENPPIVLSRFPGPALAIVLVAGNKTGKSQGRFYKTLVATADSRYARHLEYLED